MQNNTSRNTQKKSQKRWIAVLLLLGAVLAAAIVWWPQNKASGETEHGHGHEHAAEHADEEHHGKEAAGESHSHQDAAEHADEEHHEGAVEAKTGANKAEHEDEGEHQEAAIQLSAQQLKTAGISLEQAAPASLALRLELPAEVLLNEDRSAHITPRVAGVVESVAVSLGQSVKKGQVLAILASPQAAQLRSDWRNAQKRLELAQSLHAREKHLWQEKVSAEQDYLQAQQQLSEAQINAATAKAQLDALGISADNEALGKLALRAPFDGLVLEKHLTLGEAVNESTVAFTVADLRQVWVQLSVPAQHLAQVRVGQRVRVDSASTGQSAEGKVAFVGALLGAQTRSANARVLLDNPQQAWRPGLFVTASVFAQSLQVPVSVHSSAVQTVEGKTSVFVQTPQGLRAQAVQLGASDGQRVEVKQGLAAGTIYAAQGSFVLKAEQGKSAASHEH